MIGEGFHAELGGPHAEVAALADCRARGNDPAGATMFVTLEPCAHHGRQPPCTDAIVAAGIARVVIGSDDPTEKASGRGPGILRDEGIEVAFAEGADAAAARLLDPGVSQARPDREAARRPQGRGQPRRRHRRGAEAPRWISGPESRELVHRWRAESGAIAVGIGTALADDPLLTARDVGARRQPLRVVFDRHARLPLDSKLVSTVAEAPVLVVAAADAPTDRVQALRDAGVDVATRRLDRRRARASWAGAT